MDLNSRENASGATGVGAVSRTRILPRGRAAIGQVVGQAAGRATDQSMGQAVGQAIGQAIDQAIGQAKDQARHQGPRAEAAAERWIERTRPAWSWLALEWRRLGTAAAIVLIVGLLLHAMFGANGMVVYRQKRDELQALRQEVDRLQKENGQHVDQIKALKTDPAAIEKEAREQLHYTRPGEVVLVAPIPPPKPSPPTGRAQSGSPQ
jgi:cell division protein FtsB